MNPADHWLPFRRPDSPDNRAAILERVRDGVVAPLEALVRRTQESGAGLDPELVRSLSGVHFTIRESFADATHRHRIRDLGDALASWREQLRATAQLGREVRVQTLGDLPDLDPGQAGQLHLAVREAIGNAIRHSGASRLELIVTPWRNGCAVSLADNGRGLADEAGGGGLGLSGMRRRMERSGGSLRIHQRQGTVLEFRLPARAPGLWSWLCHDDRLARQVLPDWHHAMLATWNRRLGTSGSLEDWFRQWPHRIDSDAPASIDEVGRWLAAQLARMTPHCRLEEERHGTLRSFTVEPVEPPDPLHWIELGLQLAAVHPVQLAGAESDPELTIHLATHAAELPEADPTRLFPDLVAAEWADGLGGFHRELSQYLHDLVAQELVAESMRWQLARELSPADGSRSDYDRCSYELRQLALAARGLSHEICPC